jgi:hypothetical protein
LDKGIMSNTTDWLHLPTDAELAQKMYEKGLGPKPAGLDYASLANTAGNVAGDLLGGSGGGGSNALSGAAQGAGAGAVLGPWGAAAGGVLGAVGVAVNASDEAANLQVSNAEHLAALKAAREKYLSEKASQDSQDSRAGLDFLSKGLASARKTYAPSLGGR